jgi:uncharacterized alkaline shock family protein YloU
MAVKTANLNGSITVSDLAIAMLTGHTASECYGVVELVSRKFTDAVAELFHKIPYGKGVKIATIDNRIYIDVYVVLKAGINQDAVLESLKSSIKYNVESFTGMRVMQIKINVLGVRV